MFDVHLTENCDLLSKLLPADVILADRGFTIASRVQACIVLRSKYHLLQKEETTK